MAGSPASQSSSSPRRNSAHSIKEGHTRMAKTMDATERILRELADMRDDRTVMVAILERHDGAITNIAVELRALRSQFDRFRTEVREDTREMRDDLRAIRTLLEER